MNRKVFEGPAGRGLNSIAEETENSNSFVTIAFHQTKIQNESVRNSNFANASLANRRSNASIDGIDPEALLLMTARPSVHNSKFEFEERNREFNMTSKDLINYQVTATHHIYNSIKLENDQTHLHQQDIMDFTQTFIRTTQE